MKPHLSTYIGPLTQVDGAVYFHPDLRQFCSLVLVKTQFQRKPVRRLLELGPDEAQARDLNVAARRRLIEGKTFAMAQYFVDTQLGRAASRPRPVATCGEMYIVDFGRQHEGAKSTANDRRVAFLRVVAIVVFWRCRLDLASRRKHHLTVGSHEASVFPVTVIDKDFVRDYFSALLEGVDKESPEGQAILRTGARALSQVRGMLTVEALAAYENDGLFVPDVLPFLVIPDEFKADPSGPVVHVPVLVAKAHDLLPQLEQTDEQAFLIVALSLLAGLRRSDMIVLNENCLWNSTVPSIKLEPIYRTGRGRKQAGTAKKVTTKNGTIRIVPIPPWLYARLQAFMALNPNGDFLRGSTRAMRGRCSNMAKWLRGQGLKFNRTLHKLRAYFTAYLYSAGKTTEQIEEILGHGTIDVTLEWYATHPFEPDIQKLWDRVYPSQRPAAQAAPPALKHVAA